tara:strand:- start:1220 stop:2050 length:831 start_codon:yes stop_codon:yes gene_type:complete
MNFLRRLLHLERHTGVLVSEWKSWTPGTAITGGTISEQVGKWRRVGNEMEMKIKVRWSTIFTGGTFTFDIVPGYSIDTTEILTPLSASGTNFGRAYFFDDNATRSVEGSITYSSATAVKLVFTRNPAVTFSANCSTGGINSQNGSWLNTVVSGAGSDPAGVYTLTYTSNFFADAPAIAMIVDSTTSHGRIGQVVDYNGTTSCRVASVNSSNGSPTTNDVHGFTVLATRQGNDYWRNLYQYSYDGVDTGTPFPFQDDDWIYAHFKVPIVGWSAKLRG